MRSVLQWIIVLAFLLGHVPLSLAVDAQFSGPTVVTYLVGKTYGTENSDGYDGTNTAFYFLSWVDGAQVSPITSSSPLPEGLSFETVPLPLPINTADVALLGTPAAGTQGTYNVTLSATVNDTIYSYPIMLTVAATSSFVIGPGISGTWYDAQLSGQGFNIEVLPNNQVAAFFYTFDPQGNNVFLGGVGAIGSPDNSFASIPLNTTAGGFFPPNFDPSSITRAPWGTLLLHFTDCQSGYASWTIDGTNAQGYTDGIIPITRITSIATLPCS